MILLAAVAGFALGKFVAPWAYARYGIRKIERINRAYSAREG